MTQVLVVDGKEYHEDLIRKLEGQLGALREANLVLQASETLFRLLAENASDLIFRLSLPDRRYVYVSPAASKITGYDPAEFYQSPGLLEQITHPDWRQYFQKQWAQLLAGEDKIFCEYQIIHKSGKVRWVHQRNTVIWQDGQPEAIEGLVSDITWRKEQELRLRQEDAFRQAVIARAAEGLCVCHATDEFPYVQFTMWNHRMTEITGYTMEEINRLGWYQTVYPDPDIQTRAQERMARMREGEDLRGEVWEITRADGAKRLLSMSTSVLTTADGLVHVLALMLDITDERQAWEGLHQTRRHWEDIFQAIGHPTLIMDASHRVLLANRATLAVTSLTSEDILGKKCYEIFHPGHHQPPPGCPLEKLLESGHLETVEMEMEALGGTFLVSCTPMFSHNGELDKVIHIATDITERRRAQQELEKERDFSASIIDSLPGMFYLFDENGKFIRWNKRIEEVTGYSSQEISRLHPLDFFLGDHRRKAQEAIARVFLQGEASLVADLLLKSGETIPYFFTGRRITLDSGNCLLGMGIDIKARKQAEEELEREKEKYRILTEESPVGVALISQDGRYLYINPKFVQTFGYTLEDIPTGRDWFARAYPRAEDRQKAISFWRKDLQAAQVGEVRPRTFTVTCKDGSSKIINFRPVSLESGDQVVIYEDLTDLAQAAETLKESEQRYRLLVHNIPALVFTGYLDGSVGFYDDKVEDLTGYRREDFETRRLKWLELILPEDRQAAKEVFHQALKGAGSYVREYRIRTKPGEVLWIQERSQIVRFADGQIDNISGVFFDITARKRLEEERDRLFNLSLDLLCVAGFDGFFKQLNPAWSKTLGWPEIELLSRPWLDFVHPEDRVATAAAGERLMAGHPVIQFENRYRCLDGSYRWISWNSFPLLAEKLIFSVARDITEKRHLEEQFFQAQKMEAVGRLAGGVAHDFNNLLTAVLGNLELLTLELHPADPLRHYAEGIKAASDRAASLTQQLLAFSRKQVLQPRSLNLNDVVTNLEKMLRRVLGEDIEWLTVLEPHLGVIQADPGQLDQLLLNLAVNARDAMPRGGKLTIETANVDLDELYAREHPEVFPGPYIRLSVSDTGMGMEAATLPHIFEPFFTTKEMGRGTGLGLAMVYGIVKQSGGHIFVYSEAGLGTTFKLYFPQIAEEAQPLQKEEGPQLPLPGGTETILVVEDDEVLREVIAKALKKYGYRLLVAAHGGEALLLCERYPETIHLILTDVVMPHLGGQELAARLTPLHPEMKVLYMSGYTDNAIVHYEVLESGLPYLQKPFKLETLVRKVRQVLETPSEGRRG